MLPAEIGRKDNALSQQSQSGSHAPGTSTNRSAKETEGRSVPAHASRVKHYPHGSKKKKKGASKSLRDSDWIGPGVNRGKAGAKKAKKRPSDAPAPPAFKVR